MRRGTAASFTRVCTRLIMSLTFSVYFLPMIISGAIHIGCTRQDDEREQGKKQDTQNENHVRKREQVAHTLALHLLCFEFRVE